MGGVAGGKLVGRGETTQACKCRTLLSENQVPHIGIDRAFSRWFKECVCAHKAERHIIYTKSCLEKTARSSIRSHYPRTRTKLSHCQDLGMYKRGQWVKERERSWMVQRERQQQLQHEVNEVNDIP